LGFGACGTLPPGAKAGRSFNWIGPSPDLMIRVSGLKPGFANVTLCSFAGSASTPFHVTSQGVAAQSSVVPSVTFTPIGIVTTFNVTVLSIGAMVAVAVAVAVVVAVAVAVVVFSVAVAVAVGAVATGFDFCVTTTA